MYHHPQVWDGLLSQKETGFSISLSLEEHNRSLTLKTFSLGIGEHLEIQWLSLYDTAMVEIVLQGLELLFFIADYFDEEAIRLILEKKDAENLSAFDSFFNPQDAQTFLMLTTSLEDYDVFVEQTEKLKITISKELWKRQKDDLSLRHYLQNKTKKDLFSLKVQSQKKS
ncbi:hypothetical protein [Candidatus Paracaedibacter symbiosus]|uniref:hypothetical protein n=1 Tax=Candidatus Paracaedibacter symbiosus TaxID=244582 RepID=UPI000509E90A|nr:hypothetical protein [Candidatus Paracaedibacter symbiosus]